MTRVQSRFALLIAAGVLLAGIVGCPQQRPPESVLEGTWQVLASQPNPLVTNWTLTFDSNGELTQVAYTLIGGATVTWDDPPASVSVDGDALHISATESGNGLVFDGTLDSATEPTRATGAVSSNFAAGGLTISVPRGDATLVKQ